MEFDTSSAIVSSLITILLVSLAIHFGAKSVTRDAGFLRAVIVAVVGSILAGLVWGAVGGNLGLILAVAVWALIAAFMYRTSWIGGLVIGVVAWLLWYVVSILIRMLFG